MWHIRFRTRSGARYLLRVHPTGSGNGYLTRVSGPALPSAVPGDALINRVIPSGEWDVPQVGHRYYIHLMGETTPVVSVITIEYRRDGINTERYGDRALVV